MNLQLLVQVDAILKVTRRSAPDESSDLEDE